MTENSYDAAIERRNRQTKDIFEKAAQEKIINPTWVGSSPSFSQYNLHNYRLYFSYSKASMDEERGRSIGRFMWVGLQNYKEIVYQHKETSWKVTIKKTQVQLSRKHEVRDWHLIDNSHPEEISIINSAKQGEAIKVFREFVEDFKGSSDFTIINEYKIDNAVKNSLTKKIPIKARWEDDATKKLYNEDKIEIKNELMAKNFCHNAALHDFSPAIVQRLDLLDSSFRAVDLFTKQINLHLTAIQELRDAVKDLRQGNGGGKDSFITSYRHASSEPTPPNALKHNIRDIFPEGWFE